jgi:glyoxylase-like metal-dependent hydrolase (beta-lactamase superfamily II)/8-oxo-dGTP pyrophosphatase MutT (NUDIX family)
MTTLRSAAAVILYRYAPDLEVFWVRRGSSMMFQGGFQAFPGGQLDPNEDARVCAARELEEEVGVKVDPATLIDVGRWVTPAFAPRRFDTCFFLGECPAGQEARVMTGEHDLGEWIRPSDAIEQWIEGEILMATPILHALRILADGLHDIERRMKSVPHALGEPSPDIETRPGITMVPVRTPTLPPATHTNCYLIGGEEVIVIDPASPYEEEQQLLDRVIERRRCRIREIWLTHLHRDHVSGANHLRERWGVKIAAHPITKKDLAGFVNVDRTFEENENLQLDGRPGWSLRIYHTPGHARGHVCIFEESQGSLITGDLMAGLGTIVIDPPEGHMATYFNSLRRMQALPVRALFPAHGPVMANAKSKIQEYLDHRLMRENRILEAWNQGAKDIREIVKHAYTDVAPAMHGLAERSALAHLEKLREEGRLRNNDA